MKAIYLLSILSFWNLFAFAQVPVYSVHSGLSNTVTSIQEVGDSKLLLLADKSANIVLWNPASERTVASYKSLQDELLQVVLDEEYVIFVIIHDQDCAGSVHSSFKGFCPRISGE